MPKQLPSVTAIICVRNGRAFIAEALESMRRQTRPVDGILIVDDGSSDGTADVVKRTEPAARIIRSQPRGLAHARNLGASSATTDFLAFLDVDDLWPPERNEVLIDALLSNPEVGFVCGRMRIETVDPHVVLDERLMQANGTYTPFVIPSGLIRRSLWQKLGGMSPARERSEDVDLYLRMVESGVEISYADVDSVIYRFHGGNRSREVELAHTALMGTLHAAIIRRRRVQHERERK